MMKRTLSFVMVLLALVSFVFADVTVKDLGDGTAEVTFFYGNPRASEVVIAGDFTNWEGGALPMTLIEGKGWEYKTVVPHDTVMKYKFISDGNWTADLKAPDTIDDGFGGKNGLVEVAVLVAAASGNADAAAAASSGGAGKLRFQSWSMAGFQTKFQLKETVEGAEDNGVLATGLNVKSYLKVSGEALKNVPIFVEICLSDQQGMDNLYLRDKLALKDGLKNALVDTIFDPTYFYGGQNAGKTALGHLKYGITTPYVEWTAGYKYAKMPPHASAIWNTITDNWDAGYNQTGGFSAFQLGQALRQIGDVAINAAIIPNRTADRAGNRYGMAAWASADIAGHYVDLQYNGAYGTTYDTIFDDILEMDIIAGYRGSFGPIGVKVNALMNQYGSTENEDGTKSPYAPGSSDVGNVDDDADFIDNVAANVQVAYTSDVIGATVGYRMRGKQANMMYVKQADGDTLISDQLGDKDHQRVWVNLSSAFGPATVGLETFFEMTLDKDKESVWTADPENKQLFFKPSVGLNLNDLAGIDATVDLYTNLYFNTSDKHPFENGTAEGSQFKMQELGVKFAMGALNDAIGGIEVLYGLDNDDANYMFNTLVAAVKLPLSITAQAGFGIRSAKGDVEADTIKNPFGFYLGAYMPLKVLAKPTLYTQFVYGMDPYKGFGDGQYNYNLSGYTLDSGVGNYANEGAFRVGMAWEL